MPIAKFFQLGAPPISVGLDIGNFSVKVAQLKQSRLSKERYLSFGISEIKGAKSRASVVEAIKAAAGEAKLESNKANLSIYGPEIVMRYITLPCLELKELSHCLDFELERYIPGKKKEGLVIDYKILYKLLNNQMVVLLLALERSIMEERLNLVRDCGLIPNGVNIDSLALMNAFMAAQLNAKYKGVTAILDIGHSVSKLVVFRGDTLYFSRDINNGVYDLVKLACERTNVGFNLINELGPDAREKAQELYAAIRANLNGLIDELRLSFEYCWRHLQQKIGQLYLSGGGSKIKIIENTLASSLSLNVAPIDVTQAFKTAQGIKRENLKESGPLFNVAIGLAAG